MPIVAVLVRAAVLALFLVCAYGVRDLSRGDIRIPCQWGCPADKTSPTSAQAMPAGCAGTAVADLPARWKLPQYPPSWTPKTLHEKKRGPHPSTYQPVLASQVPKNCNPTAWAWARLLQVLQDLINLQLNYCHHHAPAYETPPAVQQRCSPAESGEDGSTCVCNPAGMNKANPWKGVDCSNLVAFVYNLAFGFYPTSDIGQIACHPSNAPGRLLPAVTPSNLDQLRPGDLVFITLGRKNRSPPVHVSHVVIWTGWTVDFSSSSSSRGSLSKAALMANVSDKEKGSIERCMAEKQAAGQPVYVIADSHHNGPALRPFCGWYTSSFSHARRLIEPDSRLPTNDDSIAYWNETSSSCQSRWALQG